ncbi:hypothetical protein M758_3G016200 [Ceratodon purpureus]|nr:hypothetical protein M758_3G016200 [Ceratodon purpureus]
MKEGGLIISPSNQLVFGQDCQGYRVIIVKDISFQFVNAIVEAMNDAVDKIKWKDTEPDDLTSEFLSTVIMGVSSAMSARTKSSDTVRSELLKAEHR